MSKEWINQKAISLLKNRSTPLSIKEIAWKTVNFIVSCGNSHPISFVLRPIAGHRHFLRIVGINLMLGAMFLAIISPSSSLASNTEEVVTLVAPEAEIPLSTQEVVVNPLPQMVITQNFWPFHDGIDLATPIGTPVRPVKTGKVIKTEKNWFGYGNMIVVSHGPEYESLYAHLSKINMVVGQEVDTGTIIGLSGSTGKSTGPHLHLEIHQNGKPINPALILGLR
jgi:murein DD-endopeptidase MepM/ murein hydrolase activator NlpD